MCFSALCSTKQAGALNSMPSSSPSINQTEMVIVVRVDCDGVKMDIRKGGRMEFEKK